MSPQQQTQKSGQTTSPWVRIAIFVIVLLFAFGSIIALIVGGDDDSTTASSSTVPTTPPTSAPAAASVAGQPCVPVSGTPPAGAPAVPVQTGPPPTQLVSQDLEVGTGATVAPGATVTVDYIGVACSTGAIFDSSYSRGEPATFPLTNVIPGWTQGIPGMKVGGTRLLGIPADLAYGSEGRGPDIAPDESLWFVVKVENTQ